MCRENGVGGSGERVFLYVNLNVESGMKGDG